MDEDEDVVFENSPLYQHLKDVGMDGNFESSCHASSLIRKPTEKQICYNSLTLVYVHLRGWIKNIVTCIVPKSMPTCSLDLEQRVALLNSKVLMSGDHQWLVSYGLQEKYTNEAKQPASKFVIIATSAIFAFIACLLVLLQNSTHLETSKLIMVLVFLLTTTLIAIGHLGTFVLHIYYNNKRTNLGNLIIKLVKLMESMDNCIKASLRNIQEAELIARGFTIISHKVPLMKLENSSLLGRSQRQLQQLRIAVFKASLYQFLVYRERTRYLLKEINLQSEVDNVANYIANVSEKDLGFDGNLRKFVKESWSEEGHQHVADASDNFSLSSIKIAWQTMAIQRSEFIRRLGLSLCPKAWEINRKDFYDLLPILEQAMTSLVSETHGMYQELRRVSEIHKVQRNETNQDVCRTGLESASKGQYGELWTAAHSLYLHLQAASTRVHALQERCDSLSIDKIIPSENVQAELNSILEIINPELKASLMCYQEIETKLSRLFTDTTETPYIPIDSHPSGDNENIQPIQLFGLKDDEIRFDDETFEDYTDPDEINPDERSSNMYQEETKRQRKERQQSLQLLEELRSVLPGRMAVREQLKQRNRGVVNGHNQNVVENQKFQKSREDTGIVDQNVKKHQDFDEGREKMAKIREVTSYIHSQNAVENQENNSENDAKFQEVDSCDFIHDDVTFKDNSTTNSHQHIEIVQDEFNQEFSNSVKKGKIDNQQTADNSFELESVECDKTSFDDNDQIGLLPPQFGGLWGMASLASQAAMMSSNFQQKEEVFGSDTDESI